MVRLFLAGLAAATLLTACGGGSSTVSQSAASNLTPQTSLIPQSSRFSAAAPHYTVVDLGTPAGLTGATTGYQVGEVTGPSYYCGRGRRTTTYSYVYQGTAASAVQLTGGGPSAYVSGVAGGVEVGAIEVGGACSFVTHAVVWSGTSGSYVDLQPASSGAAGGSVATATDGTHEVGYGSTGTGFTHAYIWTGTAASARDITPVDECAVAQGVSGDQVVGYTQNCISYPPQGSEPTVWVKRVASVLSCACIAGTATATDGAQEVGYVNTGSNIHAMLWNGPTSQGIDLNPAITTTSQLYAVRNGRQVGCTLGTGPTGYQYNAALWQGTVASYVDLSALLPSGYAGSCAYGVDAYGNVSGYATDSTGVRHAIIWKRG